MSELKEHQFCESDEFFREYHGPLSNEMRPYYLKSEADKVIAEKDKEIAELKQKLESVQASMYADVVDAGMENRRLKRALWLARAERAKDNAIHYGIYGPAIKSLLWSGVDAKCRAKAEEYK